MEQSVVWGLGITLTIIIVAVVALFVIAEWRILTKAGEKGWKSLIPFYNVFISHHIVGMAHIWFILEVIVWILELVFEVVKLPDPVVIGFGIAAGIFTLASELTHIIKMCNCFGKGWGFKIGMIFFPNLFFLILAFGKSEYHKPNHE
ncbi:MAG: hypothetical protein IJU16_05245 [Clostridia bacterium]|nr:hypothetical protein [Clostridia bacterium]